MKPETNHFDSVSGRHAGADGCGERRQRKPGLSAGGTAVWKGVKSWQKQSRKPDENTMSGL